MDESVSFTQLEKALATVPADAVVICTPTAFHAPLARQAFQAGKHV
ncbi:MAG: Gfo/Idh/MocA family oxidoreductase, partial [Chloroflexota bacterium]|nr:Gfo/Idh/MocA family oxidoreductase [Chloroflexota bacterium]